MNRSMWRVIVGVAGLAVLGMTATLAGAQTDAVKEKPRPYRDDSYWVFPRAHWGDVTKTTPRVTRRSSLQRSQLIAISFPGSIIWTNIPSRPAASRNVRSASGNST